MLDKLITRKTLEKMAGVTAFQRGEEYFSVGSVGQLRDTGKKVSARVEGSETYRVELWDDDGSLGYDCTCPRAADGISCLIFFSSNSLHLSARGGGLFLQALRCGRLGLAFRAEGFRRSSIR